MATIKPGDVVTVDFPGTVVRKRRPAVIVSAQAYHAARPDVILGLLTSQIADAVKVSDYLLMDWAEAGLVRPTAFRAFLTTLPASTVVVIGHLSERDWQAVQQRLRIALAVV